MIFIDEHSRIYQNWNDFLQYNKLPVGTMIAPSKGCYAFNDDSLVLYFFKKKNSRNNNLS